MAPSPKESLPNTVLESVFCGIPGVGSNTGGITNFVRPRGTGWFFKTGNAEALRATLQESLAAPDLTGLRTRCREGAQREYSQELQAERYGKLYEEVGDEGRGARDKRRGTRDEGQGTSAERQGMRDK